METSQEGIYFVDAGNNVTYINKRMAEMLGASPESVHGAPLTDFVVELVEPQTDDATPRPGRRLSEREELKIRRRDQS